MLESIRQEIVVWRRALLEAIPGETGCSLRRKLYGFRAGRGARVLSQVQIYHPEKVVIGKNVGISCHCQLNGGGGIFIGDNVLIGPGVLIWSQDHVFANIDIPISEQGYTYGQVTIEPDCWIAGGAIVLANVCLGRGTVVAAGAVVTKSTEPYSVVAGVPARSIGSRRH